MLYMKEVKVIRLSLSSDKSEFKLGHTSLFHFLFKWILFVYALGLCLLFLNTTLLLLHPKKVGHGLSWDSSLCIVPPNASFFHIAVISQACVYGSTKTVVKIIPKIP